MNASIAKTLALAAFIGTGAALIGLGIYSTRRPDIVMDDESYTRYLISNLEEIRANPQALASLRRLAEKYRAQGKTAQANLIYERALRSLFILEKRRTGPMENQRNLLEDYRSFLKEQGLSAGQIDTKLRTINQGAGS